MLLQLRLSPARWRCSPFLTFLDLRFWFKSNFMCWICLFVSVGWKGPWTSSPTIWDIPFSNAFFPKYFSSRFDSTFTPCSCWSSSFSDLLMTEMNTIGQTVTKNRRYRTHGSSSGVSQLDLIKSSVLNDKSSKSFDSYPLGPISSDETRQFERLSDLFTSWLSSSNASPHDEPATICGQERFSSFGRSKTFLGLVFWPCRIW